MNSLADRIKERLPMREVAEFYGFHPDRSGYIQCPFHREKTASLKVYEGGKSGWHCFGCGAGGSVIDFAMELFGIDFRQACVRLNADFRLGLTGERPTGAERLALAEARRREAERQEAAHAEYRRLAAEYREWWEIAKYLPPERLAGGGLYIHPLYAEAVRRLPELEWRLEENIGG